MPPWSERELAMALRFGGITLARVRYRAVVVTTDFLSAPAQVPPPPLEAMKQTGCRAAYLPSLPVPGPMPVLGRLPGFLRYAPRQYQRYYVDLTGGFEDYLAAMGSKSRGTLQRKVRKLTQAQGGSLDLMACRDESNAQEFYDLASQVSAKTYQERLLGTGLPQGEEFRQQFLKRAARGALRGYVLKLDGQPAAYICGNLEDGVLAYDYVGYDPAFKQVSPGIVLQYLALEDLFSDTAVKVFDFTEGEGQHKQTFATASRPCADIFYFKAHPDLALLVAAHHGLALLWRGLSALAEKLGLKKALKTRLYGQG